MDYGTTVVNQRLQQDYLTYVCVSTPHLDKLKRNLPLIMPYVDRALIVIGFRDEEAEAYLQTIPNLEIVYRPWDDSFRAQYQAGLDAITGGWMLWLDDDEVPSEEMLQSLRPIIQQSEYASKFDTVAFRCVDCWDGNTGQPSDYYREMLTAWNNQLRFEIDLHQAMVGKRGGVRCNAVYYHHKTQSGSLRGSCRNFFAGGVWADHKESFEYWFKETGQDPRWHPGGPLNLTFYPLKDGFKIDSWHEMLDILQRNHPEVKKYHDLDPLLKSGQVCQEFKDWAEQHSEDNDKRPHLHEIHKFDQYLKLCAKEKQV
jgi:glycosyltransferase involved in cell wall biosynthesis